MADTNEADESLGLAAYSTFAERYATFALTKPHNALYERPAKMALLGEVAGLRVLDAGCGPGFCSEKLARGGATVHAFNVTPEMIPLARTRYRRPLADILNALSEAGWMLDRVVEPKPHDDMKAADPRLFEELSQAPGFICIRARRAA
ncbi:class I SAM-dependent methyltransferase [Myxococcus fulvus]|uniref:class I SAM-dependent methyltransferase n=1 Tax=Myxococcus fulvus TaxID=33 RepID=UPI0020BE42D9|nr:methyltransferase domain-containing protein [Myxococcus fulvus]MCK8501630.1 methyltransferase domain-containing protein [Myxococcus fulvus]